MLKNEKGSLVLLLLVEQRRGWGLMIACARATRGFRKVGGGSREYQKAIT